MKKTAVVILNWNGEKLLKQFLPSIVTHTNLEDVDVVVADNNSTDGSIHFLDTHYPQIRCLVLDQNYGYAEGYNKALTLVDNEYVVLLNSDVEVTANWLQPMINYLDNHSDVAALQPKIRAQRNKSHFEYAGAGGGFIDKLGYPFCRGRIFDKVEEDLGQYDTKSDIFWASGACLMMRRNLYLETGGLDASFFAHMEEIDLCWRLNARGWRIVCITNSVIYHVGAATLKEENPRKTFLNFRNNLLMLYKNLPVSEFESIFKLRKSLDYLAASKFFLSGDFANFKAIIKAHREFRHIKHGYDTARIENLAKTTTHIKTIYPSSLLIQFYVKGVKTFSKLNF